MNSTMGESKQHTYDYDGVQYIFAYRAEDGWSFPRHRFQICDDNSKKGQYLTSNWFSKIYSLKEDLEFMIVGVKGNVDYINITSLVNGAFASYGNNDISRFEKSAGIYFKDYYNYSSKDSVNLYNNNKNNDDIFNLKILGKYSNSAIFLNVKPMDDGLYVSTPSFEIFEKKEIITKDIGFEEWGKKIDNLKKDSLFQNDYKN